MALSIRYYGFFKLTHTTNVNRKWHLNKTFRKQQPESSAIIISQYSSP